MGAYGICRCSSRDIFNSTSNVDHGDEPVGSADERFRDDVIVPLFSDQGGYDVTNLNMFSSVANETVSDEHVPKG